ncbi:MAG: DUF4097 domain-containing protein, partial [Verrucomicrobiota bacterium]|nr:DUF4097 domain-containing protein [Verrucomicrobiota bacterium]
AALLLAHTSAIAAIVDVNIEETYDVPEKVNLTIRNTDGRIYVYGSDDPQIKIKALKRAFSDERAHAIEVRVQVNGDNATIDTIYPPAEEGLLADRSGTVDYTILVPQYCSLSQVELANGEVLIEGVRGAAINAKVENGKLILRNSFALTQATVGKGSIDLFYGWWEESIPFSVAADVASGDIRLALPAKAVLHLDAAAPDGHINNQFPPRDPDAEPDHDELKTLVTALGDGAENVRTKMTLKAQSGNIRISRSF